MQINAQKSKVMAFHETPAQKRKRKEQKKQTEVAWWWARDPAEPDAGVGQGPVETVDLTRIGTGPTPSLTACQGTQARQHASRIP